MHAANWRVSNFVLGMIELFGCVFGGYLMYYY